MDTVALIASSLDKSMFEVINRANEYEPLKKAYPRLMEFAEMINECKEMLSSKKMSEVFAEIMDKSGYFNALLMENTEESKGRLENLRELSSNIILYENDESNEEPSLSNFLEEVALVADIDNYDKDADSVVLMTIHSAKGLEFPYVFLPGMEDGIFPSRMSEFEQNGIDEERRLAYVAVTRAKKKIYAIHAENRMIFGQTMRNPLSRFIAEIPNEYKQIEGEKTTTIKRKEMTGKSTERVEIAYGGGNKNKKPVTELSDKATVETVRYIEKTQKFEAGDKVAHMTFGEGIVLSVKQVGGDALIEVAFDTVGTKKLMANYAKLRKI